MSDIFAERRTKFYELMEDRSVLILYTGSAPQRSGDQDYAYTPDRNTYYLTGVDTPLLVFCASKLGGKVTEQWFIPRPEKRHEIFYGHMETEEEASERLGCQASYHDRFEPFLDGLFTANHMEKVWLDLERRALSEPSGQANVLARRLAKAHPYLQFVNAGAVIGDIRRVKEPGELDLMREAIRITGLGIESILEHMGPGVNEREIQAWFEFTIKTNGASDNAFAPIVAGGANSISLHYGTNNCDLADGDLLLVDLGAEYGYYNGDITRTFPVNGKFTEEQRYFYETVLEAQAAVIRTVKPGMHITETTKIAQETMFERCRARGIAESMDDMKRLLPHGVSHYLGLDTHDSGERTELQPGMVITVEPGIYIPELGIGIRIEDDVVITEDGCEVLSPQIIKQPDEIEAYMAEHNVFLR
ncbi:MAG: aminopeptidase P family protein [Lachnospiraceae bacterium]|nr:aminopeptidase P family protein [Lachnospiraceae bacterium]